MSNENANEDEQVVSSRFVDSKIADSDLAQAQENMLSIGQLTLHLFKQKPDGFVPDGDLETETFMEVTVPEGLPIEHFPSNGDLVQAVFSAVVEVGMLSVDSITERAIGDGVITAEQAQEITASFQRGLTEQVLHAHDNIMNNMLWLNRSLSKQNADAVNNANSANQEEVSADEQLDGFDELAGGEPTA